MGVFLVDVTDGGRAVAVGSLPTPIPVREIAVVQDGLVISSHPGGTMKLAMPKKLENPRLVSPQELRAEASASGGVTIAYLYDDRSHKRVRLEDF
jgi:hypothetical protein